MKYVLSIALLLLLFVSCGEDEEENRGGNIVCGVWDSYHPDTDSLVMRRVFTADYYSYFSFAEGCTQNELNKQRYSITATDIILDKYTQKYKIIDDTLFITNSIGDQTTKYIKNKEADIL